MPAIRARARTGRAPGLSPRRDRGQRPRRVSRAVARASAADFSGPSLGLDTTAAGRGRPRPRSARGADDGHRDDSGSPRDRARRRRQGKGRPSRQSAQGPSDATAAGVLSVSASALGRIRGRSGCAGDLSRADPSRSLPRARLRPRSDDQGRSLASLGMTLKVEGLGMTANFPICHPEEHSDEGSAPAASGRHRFCCGSSWASTRGRPRSKEF
jgi:hypothetical protein